MSSHRNDQSRTEERKGLTDAVRLMWIERDLDEMEDAIAATRALLMRAGIGLIGVFASVTTQLILLLINRGK